MNVDADIEDMKSDIRDAQRRVQRLEDEASLYLGDEVASL